MRAFLLAGSKGINFEGTRFIQVGRSGDSQTILKPHIVLGEIDSEPMPLDKSSCRRLIINFINTGVYLCGARKTKAWVILEYCKAKGVKYTIEGRLIRKL
jgi:hypothetical protein